MTGGTTSAERAERRSGLDVSLSGEAEEFFSSQAFVADVFQREAVAAFESGDSIVVTAPTGAGKTLVAEAAVHLTLHRSKRAFYTTPIKALSNQKLADFRAIYGESKVGLLTGDNVVNGDAPIVVMTTEVLRNMIYSKSEALNNLGLVVLDEVHYLQDRYRGSVWEEIIIHLPQEIPLVSLSATVANASEFTAWVRSRRGRASLIVETRRPVPLTSMYLLKDRHMENRVVMLPLADQSAAHANPQLVKLLRKGRGRSRRFTWPRRFEVVETLVAEGLLPAIYFIFSRAGCDQAASTVAAAGLNLTTPEEAKTIRRRAEAATGHVGDSDLAVLGFSEWADHLERGVAAHHAGMVPAFKEAVEDLFVDGLLKVVFATETLSLGLNMPARAVVLERLSKFTGETHETLQPGDYTQLTGRAGRRGIDTSGTAIVLHEGRIAIERIAAIASEGSHPLRSSFQPSYNMAVNLVANYERATAEELLSASFAQFRSGQRKEALQKSIDDRRSDLTMFRRRAQCDRGDIWAYLVADGGGDKDHLAAMREFVRHMSAGEMIQLSESADDLWVLLARGWGGGSPRLLLMAASGEVRRISPEDLSPAVTVVGAVELPEPVRTRDDAYRLRVAELMAGWEPTDDQPRVPFGEAGPQHGVATCPSLSEHLGWVRRSQRVNSDIRRLEHRLDRAGSELVTRFRSIIDLLEEFGYTRGWALTEHGERLRFVYNELDLLLGESIRHGALSNLAPPDLAAAASLFTFEPRARDIEGGWPSHAVADAAGRIQDVWGAVVGAERRHDLRETRSPEAGFAELAHAWCSGYDLEDLFDDEPAAGDFVRNCRQLLDLLRQLRDGFAEFSRPAEEAIRSIDRGIVSAGGRL